MSSRREGTSVSLSGCGLLFQGQEQQQVTTSAKTTSKRSKETDYRVIAAVAAVAAATLKIPSSHSGLKTPVPYVGSQLVP